MVSLRRTKIVATLGPATDGPGVTERLIAEGLDGARINTAHGTPEEWRRRAEAVRGAANAVGRPVALLMDLGGPKLRLGADEPARELARGERVAFVDGPSRQDAIGLHWPDFAGAVVPGVSEVVIGDGTPRLKVQGVEGDRVWCVCERSGRLGPRKGVFVTHARSGRTTLGEEDLRHLAVAVELDADLVALSFVRTGQDMRRLRGALEGLGGRARVIAKIEKLEAFEALDEVLAVSDGVMVARGDLGVEVGVARVPLLQKEIIRKAVVEGKLAITATQMLESMIEAPAPTRAEAADVANAILDGTSAVMLSAETAVGDYPVEAVSVMGEIAVHAQSEPVYHREIGAPVPSQAEAIMQSAVLLAQQVDAAAIVVPTTSGGSARAAAKYRPQRPLIALCRDRGVAQQLALDWGVIPAVFRGRPDRAEEFVDRLAARAVEVGGLVTGDRVVVAYGSTAARPGTTNVIVVRTIADIA